MNKAHQAILCPYCGHTQRNMEVCEACGGRFDPVSRRGVQISMGPWHLHDERVPFRPGFSFASVRRLITAGKLKSDSLIKGPTTKQLWQTARSTPGVSHLLGYCHACGESTSVEATACDACAAPFVEPAEHSVMGVPYHTPAEAESARLKLASAIEQTQGESKRIRLEHHEMVGALSLCPYCGQWQKSDERCQSCSGLFDAYSLEATMIAMGPWFVRNKRFPYLPGCSFEVLRKQIEAGRIDGSTILRGPTTKQLWAVARNTPGVGHLVGSCHHCGASAKASDTKCASCGTAFPSVTGQNHLGLAFATEAEAMAAQKQLEAQFNLTAPPTPIAPPIPSSLTGATGSHAATGVDALSGLDRASLAVLSVTPANAGSAATTREKQAKAESAASVPAQPTRSTRPAREASSSVPPRGRSRVALVTAAVVVIGIIVGILLLTQGGSGPEPDQPTVKVPPQVPVPVVNPKPPEAIADRANRTRDGVRTAWNRVETIDREGMIGLMIENAWESMQRADALMNDQAYDKAVAVYDEAKIELDNILEQSALREDARLARFEAEARMLLVQSATLPADLEPEVEAIRFKFDEAMIHFQGGSFDKAREAWRTVATSASTLLDKAKPDRGAGADR